MKNILYFIMMVFLSSSILSSSSFEERWHTMQANYSNFYQRNPSLDQATIKFFHQYWISLFPTIRNILLSQPNPRFLDVPVICGNMVRNGFKYTQLFEETYLNNCLRKENKDILFTIKDTDFGSLPKECTTLNCSTSTLGHLFYLGRILESTHKKPAVVIEFGGGYGNLARLVKQAMPDATIIIIDIPEFNAFQWLFLNETLPEAKTIMHTTLPTALETGAIHLIPVHFITENLPIEKCDVFVSTFALSECTPALQQEIVEKHFFNADLTYLVGQINGWGAHEFVPQSYLINALQKCYSNTICHPYHHFEPDLMSYEIIADNKKDK